jgi:hypothetical protein
MTGGRRRGLLLVVAALVFAFAGSAEAKKKKKPAKHHKTPSSKSTGKEAPEPQEESESSDSGAGKKEEPEEEAKAPAGKSSAPAEAGGETPGEGEAPAPATKKKHVATEAPESETEVGAARSALEVFVGAGAMFRSLTWNQNMTNGAIVDYSLAPGPEAIIAFETYPAAFATSGFASNIGAFGHFDYGFAVSSQTKAGVSLTTKFQDFLIGFKLRIPLGMVDPYVSAAYGGQTFELGGQTVGTSYVPGTSYTFFRFGLGLRVHLASILDLDAGGAYLLVNTLGSSAGDIASPGFFPNATGYAGEASLSIRFRLTRLIALRAGGDFRQYGLSLHQAQNTQPLIGGAADQYIVGWGGVELVFDGVGGGASAEEEKPAPAAKPAAGKAKSRRQPEPDLSDDAAD